MTGNDQRSLADFGTHQDVDPDRSDDGGRFTPKHVRRGLVMCSCSVCRDDTITVCVEESHRLLQIDYES